MGDDNLEMSADMQDDQYAGSFAPETAEDFQSIDEALSMFTGTSRHGLDAKGRVVVPQGVRKNLGKKFVVGPSKDFRSVALYPTLIWARHMQELKRLSEYHNPAITKQLKMMTALSTLDQECDGQGRILLPSVLRQRLLGDARDVNITGNNDHVCITSSESTEDEWNSFMDDLDELQAEAARVYELHLYKD